MTIKFCHIAPTKLIPIAAQHSSMYLTLAHLAESDEQYVDYYNHYRNDKFMIMDNSAYEYYKMHGPGYVFDPDRLLAAAEKLRPNCIVLPDYPGQHHEVTIEAAEKYAPIFRKEGYTTMFVPQSLPGDVEGLITAWAYAEATSQINIIGLSIIAAPNAYNALNSPLQRYLSRRKFVEELLDRDLIDKSIHVLGMLDGPNEIDLLQSLLRSGNYICSWDSSAAVWAACQDKPVLFDSSPTGLINGKIEQAVDFNYNPVGLDNISAMIHNMMYINNKFSGE